MNRRQLLLLAAGLAFTIATAEAQTAQRIRGTITGIDATTLSVKSRDGKDLKLALTDASTVGVAKAVRFEDIKEGDFIGTTTRPGPNGTEVAIEIHFLPPTANAGQTAWDLEPKSKMNNARVQTKVMRTSDHELSLQFGSETLKVVVPQGIPIVRTVPGTRADLMVGEYVFVAAQAAGDGGLTATRLQVSKDGVRPPQ